MQAILVFTGGDTQDTYTLKVNNNTSNESTAKFDGGILTLTSSSFDISSTTNSTLTVENTATESFVISVKTHLLILVIQQV